MEFSIRGLNFTAVLYLFTLISIFLPYAHVNALEVVDVENYVVEVTPIHVKSVPSKGIVLCERVQVSGLSRLKLGSYSNAQRVSLAPSVVIPERLHKKIHICFHKNSSLGLCECEKDNWKILQNGMWSSVISPYEDRYIDVKFVGDFTGSVTVSVELEFHRWRLLCLALGFVLLMLAPIVSSWVPFYYSSSMAIGVCLVIIILLFQGMKLLPTGRKKVLYLIIYGSVLGAGSFLLHQLSMWANSVLVNIGLSEKIHNPVAAFLLVGIILTGAGFGYWLVRRFVISEDGSVDVGIAQFVKWAIRIIAVTCIFQSTLDTPFAMALLGSCLGIFLSLTFWKWHGPGNGTCSGNGARSKQRSNKKHKTAEFLIRSGTMNS